MGTTLSSIFLAIVEKNLLKASDTIFGLVSIWLFIFRNIIHLYDLIFTLVRDLTASQLSLEFALSSLKNVSSILIC